MNIPDKQELQQNVTNHSSDIDSDKFKRLYRKCTAEQHLFLVIDTILPSGNLLHFRKNQLESL